MTNRKIRIDGKRKNYDDSVTVFIPEHEAVSAKNGNKGNDDSVSIVIPEHDAVTTKNFSRGEDGLSAYQIALEHGFAGSESEWLESLRGKDGVDGKSAYEIAVQYGYEGSEEEWLESLKPIKGVDYFTEEDIQEIVDRIEHDIPLYDGTYIITPKVRQEQILETEKKMMADDVVVEEIPYSSATNPENGYTVTIG